MYLQLKCLLLGYLLTFTFGLSLSLGRTADICLERMDVLLLVLDLRSKQVKCKVSLHVLHQWPLRSTKTTRVAEMGCCIELPQWTSTTASSADEHGLPCTACSVDVHTLSLSASDDSVMQKPPRSQMPLSIWHVSCRIEL